jgi:hypothetical protein
MTWSLVFDVNSLTRIRTASQRSSDSQREYLEGYPLVKQGRAYRLFDLRGSS